MTTGTRREPVLGAGLVDRLAFATCLLFIASIPVEAARSLQHHSVAKLAGVLAFGATLMLVVTTGRLRRVPAVLVPALLLTGWAAASLGWSVAPKLTATYVFTAVQLVLLLIVVWQNVHTRERLRLALAALCFGGTFGAGLALASNISKHGGVVRFAVGDPNDFGVMVAITTVLSVHLMRTSPRWLVRVLWFVAIVLEVIALARTGSRTAGLAAAVALFILLFDENFFAPKRLAGLGVLALVGYVGIQHYVNARTLSRIGSAVSSAQDGNLNNRTTFWLRAYDLWQGAPFNGVGAGGFRSLNFDGVQDKVAHSVFFGLLSELGLIGLALFVLMAAQAARQVRFSVRPEPRVWFAVFAAWMGAGITLTFELRKMTWVLIALASAYGLMRRAEQSGRTPPPVRTVVPAEEVLVG